MRAITHATVYYPQGAPSYETFACGKLGVTNIYVPGGWRLATGPLVVVHQDGQEDRYVGLPYELHIAKVDD